MIFLLLHLASASPQVLDRIAAVVNDDVIALSDVYDLGGEFISERCSGPVAAACQKDMELQVLDELVKRSLIRAELATLGMQVTGLEVDQAIDSIVRDNGFPDRQTLKKEIEVSGLRWDAYREQLLETLRVQRFQQVVLAPRVTVTDDEVEDLFKRTSRDVKGELSVDLDTFGFVLESDLDEAGRAAKLAEMEAVIAEVNAGTLEWEAAVTAHDTANLSKAIGGKAYKRGQLAGPIDAIVWDAEVGMVQPPLVVSDVVFIVRVNERAEVKGDVLPFEQVEPNIRSALFQEKLAEQEIEWYQRARRQAAVDILLD